MQAIIDLGPQKVAETENAILGNYPNTYTFTKAMAERAIKKKRGDLRVTIVRPSIIIANYEEPFEAWIDSLAASGGIIMAGSLGILHLLFSRPTSILDLIPCDFVSNQVLV